jgi:hypothetical protein
MPSPRSTGSWPSTENEPSEGKIMKIVVIGGTGLIASKVVACLDEEDREAVAASPDTGVNTLTGEGLAVVLEGASVVIDVSNSPSIEDEAVMEFFTTSTNNLPPTAITIAMTASTQVPGRPRTAGHARPGDHAP